MNIAPVSYRPILLSSTDVVLFLPMRRSHPRYPVQKIVSYHFEGKNFLTLTLDLGLGGMKIKTHSYIPGDERLTSKLVLGQGSIFLESRIVYSQFHPHEGSVSGVQFIEISDPDRNLLEDYLSSLNREPRRLMIHCGQEAGHPDGAASGI
jgi:hypothetical protein